MNTLGITFIVAATALSLSMNAQEDVTVRWDRSTETKIALEGVYARVIRLDDATHLAVYEDFTGRAVVSHCSDPDGLEWGDVSTMFDMLGWVGESGGVGMKAANPEVRQLSDGTIIGVCNYRPNEQGLGPYCIAVTRSLDRGHSWEAPKIIYEAGLYARDGCWEPSILELPDGTVQIYFANEAPYPYTAEQEISMIQSTDRGLTWSDSPVTVCFREGGRDGMPVPAIIGDEIVLVIEDNVRGQLQPYTVRTKVTDGWAFPVSGDSPRREFCLSGNVPGHIYMGAPYLIVLPDGHTLLSCQTTGGRDNNWERSCMEVAVGDGSARNFVSQSRPFDVPVYREGKWNSISVWDDHTVIAVSSTNKDGMAVAPWIVKGYIE